MAPTPDQLEKAKRIADELAGIGFVLPGTLLERHLTCTHAGCRCHDDPPRLHGPYWYWTRKLHAKTTSRTLTREQAEEYRAWFDNERRLRALVKELEALSISIVDDDPRSPRRRR